MDVDRLPEDVFAGEILRRVPLPGLAACRCVCRAWRAAVDRSRLLLVLPRSVRGIFSNYCAHYRPFLFARPSGSSDPPVDASFRSTIPQRQGDSSYSCFPWDSVLDHCNGLILYDYWHRKKLYVCNPATRRCALLPPLPTASAWTPWKGHYSYSGEHYYLAYDPRVSLHYEVFHVSDIRGSHGSEEEYWPPPLRRLQVFSSRTQRWEERAFVRQGEPAGTLAQMCSDPVEPVEWWSGGPQRRYAVYWRGALYVHCRGAFVMRLPSTDNRYQAIKTPSPINDYKDTKPCLGRSPYGVCYGTLEKNMSELRVWTLDESRGHMEWVPKNFVNVDQLYCRIKTLRFSDKPVNQPWYVDNSDEYEADSQKVVFREEDDDQEVDNDWEDDGQEVDSDSKDGIDVQEVNSEEEEAEVEGKMSDHYVKSGETDEVDSQDINSGGDDEVGSQEVNSDDEDEAQEVHEWNSDDDDIIDINECKWDRVDFGGRAMNILGFHPYKDVVFLSQYYNVVAYHLTSSKVQYLGSTHPKNQYSSPGYLFESYVYTPCLIDSLPENGN